jgi:hypothetical protein
MLTGPGFNAPTEKNLTMSPESNDVNFEAA